MKSKPLTLTILTCVASACSSNFNAVKENHLTKGDSVSLSKPFTVPDLRSHIILQDGKVVDDRALKLYISSCIIDVDRLGPETYQPAGFEVSKVSYNEEWYSDTAGTIRYYMEIHLKPEKQGDNMILTCQVIDGTMQHHNFPLNEIKQAVGDYFTFSATDSKP